MYFYIVTVVLVALAAYMYFIEAYSVYSRAGIKFLSPVPPLGNMAKVFFRREHISDQLEKLYFENPTERFVGRFELVTPVLLIRDIELIKKIAIKDFEHFLNHRTLVDSTSDPIFGRNLFTLKDQEWKDMRASLSPALTSSKIKLMVPLMVKVGNQMTKYVKQKINNAGGPIDIDVLDLSMRYVNDVTASCVFGTTVDSHNDADNEFYTIGKDIAELGYREILKMYLYTTIPKIMKLLGISIFNETSKRFLRNLILSSMKNREEKNIIRNDLIHLLMELKKGKLKFETKGDDGKDIGYAAAEESAIDKKLVYRDWSDDDLVAQAAVFFFAGFSTTSSGISWLLHELAMNPEVQERLSQEIKKNHIKNEEKFDYTSIQNMKYLDMVVTEALRKWPPFSFINRMCTKDFNCGKPNEKSQKDYVLRKKQLIKIPVWAIHRDPEFYPDPLKFDPERFSDVNRHKIKPYTYMPFGLGPRNCIGSRFALCEIKVMVYKFIQQFEVGVSAKTCLPEKLQNTNMHNTLRGGHWLTIRKRN